MPVVASAVGENVRFLGYGSAGVLVPPPLDAEEWAGAVGALLRDPARREQLGQAAIRRLREEYLWSKLADRIEAAYRRAHEARLA
jgi:glycosyltransferase involved in cell wall biosynthesis